MSLGRLSDRQRAGRGADGGANKQVGGQREQKPSQEPVRRQLRRTPIHERASAGRTKKPATWRSASNTTRPIPSALSSATGMSTTV